MTAKKYKDLEYDILYNLYVTQEMSAQKIGEQAGIPRHAIQRMLKTYKIPRRNRKAGGKNTYKNRDWLYQKYVVEQLSCKQISKIADCSRATIQNWLDKHGIQPRESGEAVWIARKMNFVPNDTYQDESWLREHYIEQDMMITEIAKIVDCSERTIYNWLLRFEIPIKDRGKTIKKRWEPGGIHYERIYGTPRLYRNREWLRIQYLDKKLSIAAIAKKAGCNAMAVHSWLKKHNIPRRGNEGYIEPLPYHDPDWLRQKYWDEEMSLAQIAKIAGCHRANIREWMNKHNVPLRNKSESIKLSWDQEVLGTEETRAKLSQMKKDEWASGVYDEMVRSQEPTSIEIALIDALNKFGISHESQYRPSHCRFTYDEFVHPNIFIEVNGDYWHSEKSHPGVTAKDEEKRNWAIDHGFYVVVMWEHEINELGAGQLVNERVFPLL